MPNQEQWPETQANRAAVGNGEHQPSDVNCPGVAHYIGEVVLARAKFSLVAVFSVSLIALKKGTPARLRWASHASFKRLMGLAGAVWWEKGLKSSPSAPP